jgi:hypothetical protein
MAWQPPQEIDFFIIQMDATISNCFFPKATETILHLLASQGYNGARIALNKKTPSEEL